MSDLTLTCTDCGQQFVFTEGEQAFYKEKSLPTPTLCMICRAKRKAQSQDNSRGHIKFGHNSK